MIKSLLRSMRGERPLYALLAAIRLLCEQGAGRAYAWLLGWQGSYVGFGSRVIGSRYIEVQGRAYINRYSWIEAIHNFRGQNFTPQITLGRGFSAADRLHISCVNRVQIGAGCLIGSGVYISDHNHGSYSGALQSAPNVAPVDRELRSAGAVIIGNNVWIGDNAVMVGSLTIGDGAVIGANSVVKSDVASNTIVAGAPARLLKTFNAGSCAWEA